MLISFYFVLLRVVLFFSCYVVFVTSRVVSFRFVSFSLLDQVVYEFLVRFVVSSEVDAKQAKQYVDQSLCLQLVELFDK